MERELSDGGVASPDVALVRAPGSIVERLLGVLLLRSATFRALAEDRPATRQALAIVLGVALLRSLVHAIGRLARHADTALLPTGYGIPQGYRLDLPAGVSPTTLFIGRIVVAVLFALVFWSASARMLRLATRLILHVRLERGPMLRVTGYTHLFQLLGLLPVVGPPLSLIFQATGNTVGVREAARTSTGKAILIAVLAFILSLTLIVLISVLITVVVIASIRRAA